ncbi:myb family transcription factor PHL8-like isoform X1 [Typha angustifolia]|uniref:myb family transcription factor PHL8-like isoform X1 n=1 Tax=Typha angustifolia TaxID=59011 RepID=UPI003C305C93
MCLGSIRQSQEMANQSSNQGLVLSVDAKPRLKWTRELHEQFVDAVLQLGGVDKATPKSVMRVMRIPGLTLYHLKSHLQKYRLAKHRKEIIVHDDGEDCEAASSGSSEQRATQNEESKAHPKLDEDMLQMQMEVQRKLKEQIEVQRHLQLRIEAQGKYLQSVLRKAQETLAGYSSNSMSMEAAKAELSELVSAVETECLSSPSHHCFIPHRSQYADCSTDSCLTSSEKPERKSGIQHKLESSSSSYNGSEESDESDPNRRRGIGLKRNAILEQSTSGKRIVMKRQGSFEGSEEIDLNK